MINSQKKIYPFLFLVFLAIFIFLLYYAWNTWQINAALQRLETVSRSQNIETLLSGEFLSGDDGKSLTNFIEDTVKNKELPNYSNDAVNLALREIFLVQGKNGFEQWRLKAHWATLRENTAMLNLHKPVLIYNTLAENVNLAENSNLAKNEQKDLVSLEDFLENNAVESTKITLENFYDNSKDLLILQAENGIIYDENSKLSLIDNVLARQEDNFVQGQLMQYDDSTKLILFPEYAKFGGKNISGNAKELIWDLNSNTLQGHGNIEVIWEPES